MTTILDRPMPPAPREPLDDTGAPRIGAYSGSLEKVDLTPLLGHGLRRHLRRYTQHKRWQYVMLTTHEVVACFAIVDLSYAANCFFFACDRQQRRFVYENSFLGVPGVSVNVGDRPGTGASSSFKSGPAELHVERMSSKYLGTARIGSELSLNFTLDTEGRTPPVSLVVPVAGGILNVTQKWAGLPLHGSLVVGEHRYDLDGGWGGMDYSCGLLARETVWRWAFGAGTTKDGRPVGFNLGEGINSAIPGENALWFGDAPAYLPEVRFTFDRASPLAPWRIRSDDGSVDLEFTGAGMHRESRNLILAKAKFVQVAGEFNGVLRGPSGKRVEVAGLPGVVEDQFVRW